MKQNKEVSMAESGNGARTNVETDDHLNRWLPITASRKAKWWYTALHNVTVVVGAGVLGLPCAVSQLGWISGILMIIISWCVTLYSFWLLVNLHELVPGKRFDRYHQLGQHVFGVNMGYWIVMPQQMIVQVASNIIYMVTGGESLMESANMIFQWSHGLDRLTL